MADVFQPPSEFDDYVIVQPLGSGAMGSVFLAEDTVLARHVAVKFVSGVAPDPTARQRFLIEARAAARIQHPNVASIYRVGELGDRPYLVTELVRGQSLAAITKPIPPLRAVEIAIDIARGLAAAHRRGVVHRDLKPENVMITEEGAAKLVDFGMAAMVTGDELVPGAVGTPDFMAPEIWAGAGSTRRSDVYALGGVLYELVTGKPPFFDVPPGELPSFVQRQDAPRLAGVEDRLADLVARCLARDPALRFASGDELREALERMGERGGTADVPQGNPYRGLRPFDDEHRGVFFGRGAEVGEITERLRETPLLLVTGDSGVGKSSVCRAGVLPAVQAGALRDRRTWTTITVIPGRRPLVSLATALGDDTVPVAVAAEPSGLARLLRRRAADGQGVLLFFDQMEELVTIADADEAAALSAALGELVGGIAGVCVLGSVRADLLSRMAALPGLGRELSRLLYFLRPLPPERLREVIEEPARAAGVSFETEAMIDTLTEATARAPQGGLPLLSFALAELWEARDRTRAVIPAAALEAMGGVSGALARHADGVIAALPLADRAVARRVLVRLVSSTGTRTRAALDELGEDAAPVVDALLRGRLLTAQDGERGPTYELAHEVLVAGWGTLRGWLDEDAHGRAVHERVSAAAADWERMGRARDAVWRGRRLTEARALAGDRVGTLERAFLAASGRAERRRRWLLGGGIAALVFLVAGVATGTRLVAQARVDRDVDALRDEATGEHARAHQAIVADERAAAEAFVRYDTFLRAEGETRWQQARALRAEAERRLAHAARSLEAALAKDGGRDDVRHLLAETLYDRALLAEAERNLAARDDLLERVQVHDREGQFLARLNAPSTLRVTSSVPAEVTLEPGGRAAGTTPLDLELAPGAWALVLRAPGRSEVRIPVAAHRGTHQVIDVPLPRAVAVPEEYVYVPPGRFRFGSSGDESGRLSFFDTVPAHDRWTAGYLIGGHELTYAEYLVWLDALPLLERGERLPRGTTNISGSGTVAEGPDGWTLTLTPVKRAYRAAWGHPVVYDGRDRNREQDWRRFPVTGISAQDAEAYVAWLRDTHRLPGARLCSEVEWERGARGADERLYPHGDVLLDDDANFDATYGYDLAPDEVGLHPRSTSPFGLSDMSGNAFEWTTSALTPGGYAIRGGSYFHDRKTSQIINRAASNPSIHDLTVGVRICATVTEDFF